MLKRRLGFILLAFVAIASSVACTRVETTSPSNVASNTQPAAATTSPANTQPIVATTSPANVPASTPSVDSKNNGISNSTVEPYLDTWIIKKYIPTGRVEGFSKKSANAYLGEKIIVDENQITTSEGTIKSPQFVKNELTDAEFFDKWNIYFKNAGITGSTVTDIKVSNFNINNGTEDRIGSNFIITSNQTIYTFIGGALFQLGK